MKILDDPKNKIPIKKPQEPLEELKKCQIMLKTILDTQRNTLMFATDKEYHYLFFNEAHRQAMKYAYNADIAVGRNIMDYMKSEKDKLRAKAHGDRVFKGEPHSEIEEYGDVNRSYYEFFYDPIFDDQKNIIGATVFGRDITERKKAENNLKEKIRELEQINKHMINRELKMIELKDKINEFEKKSKGK